MNRQQRRRQQKQIPKYRRGMTQEDRIKALLKNGITPDDLKQNYDEGWKQGWLAGAESSLKACYAAFIRSMRQHHRFGRKRCARVLRTADEQVMTSMGHDELIDAAWEEIGLRLNFQAPFDRIEEVEK